MNFIIELINLINANPLKRIEIIGNETRGNTKLNTFYENVKNGGIKSDREALELLYGKDGDITKYRKLKYRLKERLINSLFFIGLNQPNFTDLQQAYYYCYKNWAAIRILFGRSAKESAVALSKKIIKYSLNFEFTELTVNLSRVLRLYYATVKGDKKLYSHYDQLLEEHLYILEAELLAEKFYESLLIEFALSNAHKPMLADKATEYANKLQPYLDKVNSYNFIFFAQTVVVLQYEMTNNYPMIIKNCLKAIQQLEAKSFSLKSQLFVFYSKTLDAYMKLERFEEAEKIGEKCLTIIESGTVNWFKFYQIYFRLLCQIGNYEHLLPIVELIGRHPNLDFQSFATQESWKIYNAYTYLCCITELIPASESRSEFIAKFKLGKFLNEVPIYSKDKTGANIQILIVQILILLANQKYGDIIDRSAALERYSSRYLRKNHTFRSNCFIKALTQLPKGHFRRIAVSRYANGYIKKLQSVQLKEANQSSEQEIIPYEKLWQLALSLCQN